MVGYGIFGAEIKEPPQMTNARAILGVSRNSGIDEIKQQYRKLSNQWHPDRHIGMTTEQEATTRFKLYSSAYELLSKETKQAAANLDFQKALEEPFIVGDRIFCLGSLYGTRIFMPKESKGPRITDSSRLLAGSSSPFVASYSELQHKQYFGVRKSIMESAFADTFEMYYGGQENGHENVERFREAFMRKDQGGLDDLVWIRNNELGAHDFLNRNFQSAAKKFADINHRTRGNVVFMFRYGVCLEAMAAEPIFKQNKKNEWQQNVRQALRLYESCIQKLVTRRYSYPEELEDPEDIRGHDPTSMLTVMMQAADAYDYVGEKERAKRLWNRVKDIDPNCYEAQVKCNILSTKITPGKIFAMLMPGKRSA